MSIRTVTPPAAEPVTLDEMKLALRIDHEDEDTLIAALIRAARERVEAMTGRAMILRDVVQTLDAWPGGGGAVELELSPVSAVTAVRTLDQAGAATSVSGHIYYADLAATPPRLALAGGRRWPPLRRAFGGIEIAYTAGYGAGAEDAPGALRHAVREIAADAYERGGDSAPPPNIHALLAPFRSVRL